ncbi:hypothetical protein Tco_0754000 [Tanacetum coccineum]
MDLEVTDASTQQNPKQIDEEFTTTAYPNVQENLKLLTEDKVILEEPTSSTGTLSSLQDLDKELSFTNQFLVEKPQEEEPKKTNNESEVQLMVTVPIHQDTSSVPPMTTLVIDLTLPRSVSTTVHAPLPTSTTTTTAIRTTTSLPPLPPQPQQSTTYSILLQHIENLNIPQKVSKAVDEIVTDAVDWAMQALLRSRFSVLPAVDMKEALEKSLECDYSNQLLSDLDEARIKKRKKRASPRTPSGSPPTQPPLPPPLAGMLGALNTLGALGYSQFPPPPPPLSTESSPIDSLMNDDSIPDEQVQFSDDEDTGNDHLPNADMRKDWYVENNWASALVSTYEPLAENSLLAKIGDMTTFMNWYCCKVNKTVLTQSDFEGHAYEFVKAFYPDVIHLQFQIEECHKMLTYQINWANPEGNQVRIDDLEYLRYDNKGSRPALSISKMKVARYPDFGLELLVPEQMWIDEVCTYEISDAYGISHWWFNQQKFYIKRHDSLYDYLSEIILRRANFQEYKIAEKDFKNLYPSDFEDLNLLLLQCHLDHLSGFDKRMLSTAVRLWTRNLVIPQRVKDFQLGIESYLTQLNLTKPGWDAKGYEFKHDYTIIESS